MLLLFLALVAPPALWARNLSLTPEDLQVELRPDGGFHLFIRHNPDISSVLLTETTRDPLFRAANYAYRAAEWNPINGDEIRLIDGVPNPRESGIYSLVSSTPRWHPTLGWAFHIYIPNTLLYGYEHDRHGEVQVSDGTYLNIRTFYYAHADYRGPFRDNPFMLRISQEFTRPPAERGFLRETVEAFTLLAGEENTSFAINPAEMMEQIREIIAQAENTVVDIVLCLDVTASMRPFFGEIRQYLIPTIQEMAAYFESVRVGMVFFKDYFEEFLYRVVPFTQDFTALQRSINNVRVSGGGDIPEAVHEALFAGATQLAWESETRIMILIGDAPPHPRPRGRITRAMVDAEIVRQGIDLHAIVLPHP
ncbi:MAG: VWA domain-containing protein [Treponema sp.]|nr:VWA domain-containing protein [Treponema sp.]